MPSENNPFYEVRRDLPRQRVNEKQLQYAQKMEAVGRLAAVVAHDQNNMHQVILGCVEMAREKVPADAQVREELDEIQRAAEHSVSITRQLLSFARDRDVTPEVLDLNGAVTDTLKMIRRLMGAEVAFSWRPGEGIWPVFMDTGELYQILVNLCVNAREAVSEVKEGAITVGTENARMDESACEGVAQAKPGDYVCLSVRDNGRGMDLDAADHLFDSYFNQRDSGQGAWTGLVTVYDIVARNGGFVTVESRPGHGTSFHLHFPRHKEGETKRVVSEEAPAEHRGKTFMVVEDEKGILATIQRVFERQGHTVMAAGSAEEAIRLAKRHTGGIDLLLTDMVMPGMNGRELAEHMRLLYPEIKCLFMSGYSPNFLADLFVIEGAFPMLEKPFSVHELLLRVSEALGEPYQAE